MEVDLLRQRVKVRMEENMESIGSYANAEIAVLRNGKAKKNDPPIPADLAPISGGGRRRKRFGDLEDADNPVMLDSIKLRYSEETIAEEQPVAPVQEEGPEAENKGSRQGRNRRRNRRSKAVAAQKEAVTQEAPTAPQQPKKEGEEAAQKRRRPNHRRRRGNKPAGSQKAE